MSAELKLIQNHPAVWTANSVQHHQHERIETPYSDFNKALQGGIPAHGMMRIKSPFAIGELSALISTFIRVAKTKLFVMINPPARVNSAWLEHQSIDLARILIVTPKQTENNLWVAEQCLKSQACGVVLVWHESTDTRQARRLQVAAKQSTSLCVLYEYKQLTSHALPINLDLHARPHHQGINVDIVKQLNGWPTPALVLPFPHIPTNKNIHRAFHEYQAKSSHYQPKVI